MTVAEYIFDFLARKGIDRVFMVSGSSAMWLTDALKRNGGIKAVCNHHEQASAMCADLYGRLKGIPGAALVTIGPGATNAVTGVAQAYLDSSPMIVISGQANSRLLNYEMETFIRQHGTQSLNLEPLIKPITKYFAAIMKADDVRYHLERAYYEAVSGRPGPVWLDIPVDIQNKQLPGCMRGFEAPKESKREIDVKQVKEWLKSARKPLILAGGGARGSDLPGFAKRHGIPVATSRMGIDIMRSDDALFVGRPGSYGDRASHFAIQQCDLLLILGCRLSVSTIGYYPGRFAMNAKKVMVDIDEKELDKPDVPVDMKICCDAREFIGLIDDAPAADTRDWVAHCRAMREKYPVVLPEYASETPLNSYYFTSVLTRLTPENSVVVVDTGSVCNIVSQSWRIKKGQRYLISGGLSCMGFFAGASGCCGMGRPVIALTGDGSAQMNIQELATFSYNNFPVKLFIYNNNGYMLIRHNQHNYMDDRFLGVGPDSGLKTPDFCKVAQAYGVKAVKIEAPGEIEGKIAEVLEHTGPVVCEVAVQEFGVIAPRIASRVMSDGSLRAAEFDDLYPFLNEGETGSE